MTVRTVGAEGPAPHKIISVERTPKAEPMPQWGGSTMPVLFQLDPLQRHSWQNAVNKTRHFEWI
jgi:hypothetical protein